MKRRTIAKGIYEDAYGYEVRWTDRGQPRSKRFARDTALQTLKAWREMKVRLATAKTVVAGSFVRDAVRFLAGRKHLASFKSDRSHLRPWIHRFARKSRLAIDRDAIHQALVAWDAAGYSPRELRHRRRILRALFAGIDPDMPNPCAGVKLPRKVSRPRPRSVSDMLVRDVALNLRRSEIAGRLRDAKTRARFLVDTTCGQRPIQAQRARPDDVDLDRRMWFVEPAKGDAGTIVYLNDDMLAAWTLFVAARAWGVYDRRSYVRTLQRNGWPKGIRPYTLRHTVGLTMSELGIDLGDIQAHMGHSSPTTTRMYVPTLLSRLKRASARIDGRFASALDALALPRSTTTIDAEEKAKDRTNRPESAERPRQAKGRLRSSKPAKTA